MSNDREIDLLVVLEEMRNQIGLQAQENAVLKATIKWLEDERNKRDCSCSKND